VIERLKLENEKLREKIAGQATQIAEADQQITKPNNRSRT
jgi:regulator of replication initiation timing